MNHSFHTSFKADILIVDDTLENLRLLSNALIQMGYKVRGVMTGQMAIMAVQTLPPDLIPLLISQLRHYFVSLL